MKNALVTGITGQDGSYLAKLLLEKNYTVYAVSSADGHGNDFHNFEKLQIAEEHIKKISYNEIKDLSLDKCEVYNLAGQSSVGASWSRPLETFDANLQRYIQLLEGCKGKNWKILQASSGEMYGSREDLLSEKDSFNPSNPYALSKYAAHKYGQMLRDSESFFITNVILFNHESPLRDSRFVIRKIIDGAREINEGKRDKVTLGNIEIERDWGFAEDYVYAMWQLLQQDTAIDINMATGHTISLKTLIQYIFMHFNIDEFEKYITIDQQFIRPNDVKSVKVDVSKLNALGISLSSVTKENIYRLI